MLIMLNQLSSRPVVAAAAAPFESLSNSTSSLNSTTSTFYTSDGVILSAKTNWIAPVGTYKNHCHLCNYFGHGLNNCPNIRSEFLGRCCRCWTSNHESKECTQDRRAIPFKKNFLKPSELLKKFGLFEE